MKKRILAFLLAVSIAVSMLVLPASAASLNNSAIQTAITLGAMDTSQTGSLDAAVTRGAFAKMLVSFTRIDSANIMLAQTPVFMGVPNVGKTDSFDGYSCVVPDAGSIAELLNTYFRNYTGPVSAEELNLVTNDWPHGTASTSANVQFVGQLDKESDDAILSGDTDVAGATTTDGQVAGQ